MCIPSRDLNYAKNNSCDFIKNNVQFCRNLKDVFCFIDERILLTHMIVLARRSNMLHETRNMLKMNLRHGNSAQNFLKNQNDIMCVRFIH